MCRTATPGGIAYPLTILANETSATRTFTYTPEDDSEPEPPEVVVLEVVASDGDLEPGTATLTIIDDDAASAITLSVSPEWVAEDAGGTTVTVTAALDAGTRPTATEVTVSRTGGTATSGTDHAAVDAFTVTIRAEQTSGTATFTFTPLDDSAADGAETVILSGSATGLETGTATLTITDDESVPTDILLSVSQESVAETAGATTVRVTVALDAGTRPTATFVLVVQTGGTATSGTDYAAVNDLALRIPPNETSATATFTFTPADDSLREAPETVIMDAAVLGVPDLGDWGDRATLTIIDDDAAALIKLSVSPDSVAEDAGPTTVTVTAALDGAARATATTVTVTRTGGTAILGSDYAPVQDFTVTIRAEQTSVTGTFTFTPLDDSAAESAETVVLGERMHNTVPAMLYIVDDDDDASTALELSVSPDSVAEDAGPTTITATVALNGVARTTATQVVVFVPFDDYGPGGGIAYPLTILANETSATRTFTYTPEDDSEPEPPEVVVLEVVAADGDLDRGTATLTIIDDDASTALELSVSPDSVAEDAGPTMITATVALNRAPRTTATPVFVSWIGGTATPGADYTSLDPMVLTIPADSASVTGTFTFTPLDDSAAESAETVILGAEPTVSSGLRSVAGDTATLTIIDDDASTALELSVSPDSVAEDAGATTVTVTAALDGAPRATATTVTVSDGGTGTAVSGTDYAAVNDFTLTIPADSASVTGTFAFTPLDDSAAESAETVVLSGSATGLETGTATLTIADAENSAPAFSDSTLTRSIAENTAADTNVGAVVPAATDTDAGDTLTYSMEGADTASFTFDAATRQIKTKSGVTYDHEAKSSYSVTVKVDDGNGGTDTVPVTVTVTDVAEPPLAPNAPTVTATAGSTTSLDVTWTAPTNTGKPAIDNYDLQYRVGTSGSFTAGPQNQTGLSASIGGLTANTSYEVQVHAHNDEGDGPWSPSGTGSTSSPTTAPDVPTGFMAFPVTPFGPASTLGKIGIAWDAAAGGTAPTGYQYQVDAGGGYGNWTTIPNSAPGEANATGYRIPSLKTTDHARNARPSHSVRLRAVSGAVEGAETDAITVDGFQFAFTVEAVDAAVDEGEDARFRVTVTLSPAGPDPNCAFDGAFTFISSVSSTGGVAPARVDQRRFDVCVSSETFSVPTTDDTTQEPNGTVTFTLSGKNNPDDGFFATPYPSATVTVRDDDSAATAPDAPSLAAGAGDGSVTLAWETPGDGGSAITGYEYRQSTDGGANFGAWTSIPNSASLNSYTVRTNIANGTTYTFEVRAVNALGESDESNRVSVTPPGDRPENMKAVPGNRQIGISWDPPSAGGNAPILDYAWRQSPDGTDWGPWQSVGGRSVRGQVVKELTNGQPYYFQARARDRFGWGPASNTVSATPNPTWRLSTALEGMVRGGVTNATRVTITNSGTFATDETIELRWKGTALTGEIRGRDIVIPAGENHGTTTLSARTDGGTEHFDLPSRGTLSARWNGRIIGSRTLTIHDDEAKPVIGMSVSKAEVVEGEDIEIAVKAGPTGFALQTSVEIHVTDPNGRLIAAADRTVTFATGETSKSVTMGTVDDSEKHRDQPVIFGLHRPFTDHASESYTLSNEPGEGLVEVLVRDNDETRPEMPEMWVSDAKAYEVNKRMVFGVFLDREATTDVSVDYTTRDGSARAGQDYTATSGTLVFEPGDRVKAIFVPIIDDSVRDDGETFTIKLSNVSGAEFRDDEATGTIHNSEEEPELSVADAEATEEEDNTLDFVVTLDPAAGAAGSVDYATADGTATAGADYTATSGTLTFVAGDTEKTIAVPIIDDTVDDGGETFTLTLGNASGATIADASATGTIRNREETSAPLTASFGGVPASHDGATAFTFGLTFSEDVAGLSYKTLRDSALSVTNGRATRARRRTQGNNQGWTITVEPDSPAAVTVRLPAGSVVTSDGRGLESAVSATVAGPVGISVADARAREGTDAAIDFAVSLSRAASGTVTVDYATANGSAQAGADYTATSGTLTFAVGQTSKTVSVAVLDDSHDDGGETFTPPAVERIVRGADCGRTGDRNDRQHRPATAGAPGAVRAGDGAPRDGPGGGAAGGVQDAGPARPVRGP